MSKKAPSSSSTKHALSGTRILVGRARHQAGALSAELRKLGAQVIEIPFIEIRKPRSFKPLDAALRNLATYDWLILTSVNGVDAMWERLDKIGHNVGRAIKSEQGRAALAHEGCLRVAAIGPATKKAIEQRGATVDVVPREYIAESVVRSLKNKVKGKRVLLVRAKVARDLIPRELREAGAHVDVVEAYETVVPQASRGKLLLALQHKHRWPHIVTFTSSSTVRNFVGLLGGSRGAARTLNTAGGQDRSSVKIRFASIGPVTSATLREFGLRADIKAKKYTIPGLVSAIVDAIAR